MGQDTNDTCNFFLIKHLDYLCDLEYTPDYRLIFWSAVQMNEFIIQTFHRLIEELNTETTRYLYPFFSIKNRLTGIIGPRGVGKTTLLLQYIKNNLYSEGKTIYFTADLVYFNQTTLLEFVTKLYNYEGYRIFFIDEIHKYKNWIQEVKNLYDAFPSMKIIFSGSSMMHIVEGSHDLSRRATLYRLGGMSFREYLNFKQKLSLDPIDYTSLMKNYKKFGGKLGLIEKIIPAFHEYLRLGYYPFVFEDEQSYYEKILRIVDKTIYEDISNFYNLKTPNLHYFKKLLSYLASIPPGEVNTNNLSNNLGLDNKTTFHYLQILNTVGLARFIEPFEGGSQILRKPSKIFLHNTTLMYALETYLGQDVKKGAVRELFFIQSLMDANLDIFFSKQGDYRTKDAVFEIGGKNKTNRQIQTVEENCYLIKDDILVPAGNEIPLFYFGFTY